LGFPARSRNETPKPPTEKVQASLTPKKHKCRTQKSKPCYFYKEIIH
jgi:hypothetical protein